MTSTVVTSTSPPESNHLLRLEGQVENRWLAGASTSIGNEEPIEGLTRRIFIVGGAAVVSGLSFWGMRRAVAPARPLTANEGPREVTIARFDEAGLRLGAATLPRLIRSDAEWRRILGGDAYWVMRHADTERPFTGALLHEARAGVFDCAGCNLGLFSSAAKFDSGTGWPSFWEPIAPENVVESPDGSLMEVRTAVSCRLCDGHLGHVFTDGPKPTGLRFCMNSVALRFRPARATE